MTPQEIENKLEEIEERSNRQYKIMKNVIEKIGKQMNNDFNFDDLLDDIEENPENPENPKTEIDDLDDLDNLLNDNDNPIPANAPEVDLDHLAETSKDDEIQDYKKLIEEQKARIKELEDSAPKVSVSGQAVIEEFGPEIKAFAKEMLDIDMRKKVIQEEIKTIKDDYKDRGVDIPWAMKAMKEIQKELKETSEEAAGVQATKDFLRKDESIVKTLDALSQ